MSETFNSVVESQKGPLSNQAGTATAQYPQALTPEAAASALSVTGTTYQAVGVGALWPPRIPAGARFLPIERFSSIQQIMQLRRSFEVVIDQNVYNKMMYYSMKSPVEVSGFGRVARVGNSFTVQDVMVLDQVNTDSSSRISEETLNQFMKQMGKHGLDTEGYDLYWHSHVNMEVFFSPQDMATIEELHNSRFTLSIVVNKRLESRCRVDFYDPARFSVDNLPLKVAPAFSAKEMTALDEQMGRSCRVKTRKRAAKSS